jgi:tetratricopeptide (TPR) repeat protein
LQNEARTVYSKEVKRLLVAMILSLLALLPRAWADGPDDQYVTIYNLIQQGDVYYDKGQVASARARYEDALSVLKRFQAANPDWNVKVVKYRINYLSGKLRELAASEPAVTPPPAAPAPAVGASNAPQNRDVTPVTPPLPPAPIQVAPKPEVATPAPAAPVPVVTPPAVAPPAAPPQALAPAPAPVANSDYQINALQDQIRRLEGDKVVLEAKLKEALAARPASVDPREMAQTQAMVRELQKENELLKTSLAQAQADAAHGIPTSSEQMRQALAEANRKLAQLAEANATLTREKESLQSRVKALANPDAVTQALREENEILKRQVADLRSKAGTGTPGEDLSRKLLEAQSQLAVLQSDKELLRLEKMALESRYKQMTNTIVTVDAATAEKIKRLESQRDELQKSLDTARSEIEGHRKGKTDSAKVEQMTQELVALHARIEALEAVKIPYTPEELALFDKPPPAITTNPNAGKRSVRELPPEGAVLIAEAKRYYAGGELDKAEQKYQEVLKLNEKNVSTLTDLAMIQIELNHLADAEKHIQTALAIETNDDYSLMVLGHLRFQQNRFDEALESFSRAAKLNPKNPEIQNFIGITLSEKGLRGPAEAALRRAVQIDPNYASARLNLAFVYLLQKPPLVELARWEYQKALAAHHPRDLKLEKLLDPDRAANGTP